MLIELASLDQDSIKSYFHDFGPGYSENKP